MSLASYTALSTNDPALPTVLNQIINANSTAFSDAQRASLIDEIFNDLRSNSERLPKQHVALALLALKTLGRMPSGSQAIASKPNLSVLRSIIQDGEPDAVIGAMKCVANALLLLDPAREEWAALDGGEACMRVLDTSRNAEALFSASRILFLLTVKISPFLKKYVEEDNLGERVCACYEPALAAYKEGDAFGKDALVDLLKVSFNLLLLYPRMIEDKTAGMGELWNERLQHFLTPLLRLFTALPPVPGPSQLVPPLTHTIHALLNIPVEPYAAVWLGDSASETPSKDKGKGKARDGNAAFLAEPLHKAITLLHRARAAASRTPSPSPPPSRRQSADAPDALSRAYDLLDGAMAHYFPGDPDDESVRKQAATEGVKLDDLMPPLLILLTRLANGSPVARSRLRECLLPANLDRTKPLEERADLLGRCLRLLKCVYFNNVKDMVGEMIFAICDNDASTMSGLIGYGNAAGYLFQKGLAAPPASMPRPSPSTSATVEEVDDTPINPITGTVQEDHPDPMAGMTEEEKEREAERLFVLFDRLERTGVSVTNPFRQAFQEGKIQYP